jgi:hypothetical protein
MIPSAPAVVAGAGARLFTSVPGIVARAHLCQLPAAVAVNTTTLNISVKKGALPVPALEKKETTTASPTKEKLKKSAKGTKSKKNQN